MREHVIEENAIRIDAYLAKVIPDLSRSYAASLIAQGNIRVDGKIVKPSYKAGKGSILSIDLPEPKPMRTCPEDIPLDIFYEDEDLLVINKPQGMVVHPAPGHHSGTLVHALLFHCMGQLSDINGVIRPGIVHRIDKDTSGLMLAVKNNRAHEKLAAMIAAHEIVRKYRCIVHGTVDTNSGIIDAPIGRSGSDRRRMVVCEGGKPSVTRFTVVERFRKGTDLALVLETGRTHQIRAHMTYIGHPPIGDLLYAPKRPKYELSGQALHSCSLSFFHPLSGEKMQFDAPLPEYYTRLIHCLRDE